MLVFEHAKASALPFVPCISAVSVDVYIQFLEVAIHQVLFARQVYPEDLFERRRAYGMSVWMGRHAQMNRQIHDTVARAKPLLLSGAVDCVSVVLLAEDGTAAEQFDFEFWLGS